MSHFLKDRTRQAGPGAGSERTDHAAGRPAAGAAVSEEGTSIAQRARSRPTIGGHPHGRPSSWALTGLVVAAFTAGGIAIIFHLWWLVYVCAGVVVAAVPTGKLIKIMDDTVV